MNTARLQSVRGNPEMLPLTNETMEKGLVSLLETLNGTTESPCLTYID